MSFSGDLDKFHNKTMENLVTVKREASFDLFSAIITETPVDFGVLRNNWFAQIGNPATATTEEADKGNGPIDRTKTSLQATDLTSDIFFTNNLPYAIPIEFDGLSGKAKEGMVRVNAARWDSIVRSVVRRITNGV